MFGLFCSSVFNNLKYVGELLIIKFFAMKFSDYKNHFNIHLNWN